MPDDTLMERLLQESPNSLAMLLEGKINPQKLSDADKADYAFWLTKTHKRQQRSLMNDSLIHFALNYYKETDSPQLLETYLLASEQINWSSLNLPEAIRLLEDALVIADQKQDTLKLREICYRLVNSGELHKDIRKIDDLIQIVKKYDEEKSGLSSYITIIEKFNPETELDSITKYAKIAMDLARETNHPLAYSLTRKYVDYLNASGRSKESLMVLRELENSMPVGNEINFNYIATWIELGVYDSARARINALQPILEKYRGDEESDIEVNVIEIVLGIFQTAIQIKEGRHLSMKNIAHPTDHLLEKSRNKIKIDRERQFVQHKLEKENLMLDIERGQFRQRILWISIFILAAVVILIFLYQRKLLKKERSVQQAKEQLRYHTLQLSENESIIAKNEELIRSLSAQLDESDDLKQEISTLVNENDALKQKNKRLHTDIEHYSKSIDEKDQELDTFEKLTEENAKLQERERFLTAQLITHTKVLDQLSKKPRYIEESQWPEIVHAINQLFDGFSYRLHTNYPVLTEEDIHYACLIKLRLSTSVIALLMGISPSSVTKRKQRVKEKMYQHRPTEIQKEQALEIYFWN